MGIVILSFTIKDVHDDVDHLESLGKARTAEVRWGLYQTHFGLSSTDAVSLLHHNVK